MPKTCTYCGEEYLLPKWGQRAGQEASRQFCSHYCQGRSHFLASGKSNDGKIFTCRTCGKKWVSAGSGKSRFYCSSKCSHKAQLAKTRKRIASRTLIFTCLQCGKIGPKVGKQKFCSVECRKEYYRPPEPDYMWERWWEFRAKCPPPVMLVGLECRGCGENLPFAFSSLNTSKEFCSDFCYQNWYNATIRFPKGGHLQRALYYGVEYESIDRREIYERDGWICQLCGKPVDKNAGWPEPHMPSLDHIIPMSLGGSHLRTNIQCAHLTCNLSKGNRAVGEQLLLVG